MMGSAIDNRAETGRYIMDVLSDGQPHRASDIHERMMADLGLGRSGAMGRFDRVKGYLVGSGSIQEFTFLNVKYYHNGTTDWPNVLTTERERFKDFRFHDITCTKDAVYQMLMSDGQYHTVPELMCGIKQIRSGLSANSLESSVSHALYRMEKFGQVERSEDRFIVKWRVKP